MRNAMPVLPVRTRFTPSARASTDLCKARDMKIGIAELRLSCNPRLMPVITFPGHDNTEARGMAAD